MCQALLVSVMTTTLVHIPLQPGYADRRDLYNLYHLLNYLNLFGAGYLGSVQRIVRKYMRGKGNMSDKFGIEEVAEQIDVPVEYVRSIYDTDGDSGQKTS